jgi:hypothetical protein
MLLVREGKERDRSMQSKQSTSTQTCLIGPFLVALDMRKYFASLSSSAGFFVKQGT